MVTARRGTAIARALYGAERVGRKRDELAGIDQRRADRSAALIARSAASARGAGEPRELGALHLADAVLGRDRSARRDDQIVDEAA